MTTYSSQELLDSVNQAIIDVTTTGVSTTIDGQQWETTTLAQLRGFRSDLLNEIAQGHNGGLVQNFFQGRMSRGRC